MNQDGTVGVDYQPPSGGCVLKLENSSKRQCVDKPAAFRRLCVETESSSRGDGQVVAQPPSGGCVLKQEFDAKPCLAICQPPSGGCVLKQSDDLKKTVKDTSRLQAAVC